MQTWYVYTYAYPKEMGGAMFYAGKGTGTRMFAHEMEARNGCPCFKCETIRSIWANGYCVQKSIVMETLVESEAYQHENNLIKEHASTLVNVLGIPEELRRERNYKETKKTIARILASEKLSCSDKPISYDDACKYCQLGFGHFIHYSKIFGLEQSADGTISGYRKADLIRFKDWMQKNYPRVGTAHKDLLEREKRSKERKKLLSNL